MDRRDRPHPVLRLTARVGNAVVSQGTFRDDVVHIGSSPQASLRVEDPSLRALHVAIEYTSDDHYELVDMGGGTFVDGRRVTRTPLGPGSKITIGSVEIDVDISRPRSAGRSAGPAAGAHGATDAYYASGFDDETFLAEEPEATRTGHFALRLFQTLNGTVIASKTLRKVRPVRIGEGRHVDFGVPTELLGQAQFELLRPDGDALILCAREGVEGAVRRPGGPVQSLEEARAGGDCVRLERGSRFVVRFGPLAVAGAWDELPKRPPLGLFSRIDVEQQVYMLLSVVLHLSFMALLWLIPEEQLYANHDPYRGHARLLAAIQLAQQEEPEKPEEKKEEKKNLKHEFEVERKEVAKKEEEPRPPSPVEVEKPVENPDDRLLSKLTPKERRKQLRARMENVGVNKYLNQTQLIAELTGEGNGDESEAMRVLTSVGPSDATASGLAPLGDAFPGAGGPGANGGFAGPGGGGGGPGGAGGPFVPGLGKGAVTGGKRGLGKVAGIKKRKTKPRVDVMVPMVSDGYDKENVRRVIRRNITAIRYCYEKELQRNPSVRGKLVLLFFIGPGGKVVKSRVYQNQIGSKELGACLVRKSRTWVFPPPQPGAVIRVKYPFVFKPAGR